MKKIALLLAIFAFGLQAAIAQTKEITGTVTSAEDGSSIPGVSVSVKGTTLGTITNIDGEYTLKVPQDATTLIFSFVGMQSLEAPISGAEVNAQMEADVVGLNEVVVTAFGISKAKKALGYAATDVSPEDAIQKSEPDLFRSLDGKIPGVQINASSSTPGSSTKVLIRGNSSFLGNNDPLYVVDGIPYSNTEVTTGGVSARLTNAGAYGTGLSTLDPNNIESMEVLKGAAAAALYGSRAANGVVLITTKSGRKGQAASQKGLEVTVTSSYSLEQVASLPDYQNSYGQGSNFLYSNANGSWGPSFASLDSIATWSNYLAAYPEMAEKQPYQAYPNNVKDLFGTGSLFDNSVNIASNNDKGNVNLTISRLEQDGYIPHSEFERSSFSVGGNQKLENGLTVGGSISFSRTIQEGPFFGAGNYGGSVSSFARTLLMPRNIDAPGLPYETPDGRGLFPFSTSTVDNPLWSWKYNKIKSIMDRTVTTINAGYDFTDWLSASYQFGWNNFRMDRKQVINIGSVGPSDFAGAGQIKNDIYQTEELESNFNVTLNRTFGTDYDLRLVLGHNFNQRSIYRDEATGNKMIFKGIYNVDNTQEQIAEEYQSRRRLWAVYADLMFGYKNYAFLNFSLRNDHSSTLPVEHQSYFYPAVTASFVFTDALEINPKILNFGKVRAGWGRVGNDASPYYVNGTYLQDTPFDGRPIMLLPTISYDPELKPEFTSELEFGTELQFFNSRIGIDFTWYDRRTTDQIAPLSLPSSTGTRQYYTNFGELKNEGIELGVNLVPISLKNSFKWDIYATYSKNDSEVISLIDGTEQITLPTGSTSEPQPTLKPGYPYGFLRGSVIARAEDGTPLVNPSTGSYMEASELGDLGDPNPDFIASINNTFSYKGVSLGMKFDARVGGVISSGPASDLLGRGVTKDTEDRLGTRILPGILADPDTKAPLVDASGNTIPNTIQLQENDLWFASASTEPTFAMNSVDEFRMFDATVFRLSEVILAYDIPRNWLRETFIGSLNLSVIARNLWHYAPGFPEHTNYDPGSNAFGSGNVQGIDRESAPSTRRIGFNIKLTF
ncbi:SusC/RagA family TonB-linked outer membrane protein [Sunxiuqinia elliptica]|uniref:TonB-linked SusC/RagA family outer membrane protein n=1 Tax=Sunxiuqinia elliptica TaxID=655355 RepID=A0A4R6H3I6_9BACT|nr:SusC/RagA family TonB-linked outer membrane protein [Sunxiuqinia elliptica]TDO02622.1 TonB-linked SusC/RagA family outer membrane protein [Sunxiuqinia elliptica]TDO58640.1 TonB-linked SusC/RagA family outer membrane protein [Sunxiuqinia elliptica]